MKTIDIRLRPSTNTSKIIGVYNLESVPKKSEYPTLFYDGWDGTAERPCLHLAVTHNVYDMEVNTVDKDGDPIKCVYSDCEGFDTFFDLTTVDESALSKDDLKGLNVLTDSIKNMDKVEPWSYDDNALLKMIQAIADRNKDLADHFIPEYLKLTASMRCEDYDSEKPEPLLIDDQPMDNYEMHFRITIDDKEKFSFKKIKLIGIKQDNSAYSKIFDENFCKFEFYDDNEALALLDAIIYDGKLVLRTYWDMGSCSYKEGKYAVVDRNIKDLK